MTKGQWNVEPVKRIEAVGFAYQITALQDTGARWPVALCVMEDDAQAIADAHNRECEA